LRADRIKGVSVRCCDRCGVAGLKSHHFSVDAVHEFLKSPGDGAVAEPCGMVQCLSLDGVLT
jgi:hypothetical protein